jgi:hypothetical protein
VNFVDATLVRLADQASRAGLFDEVALEQIVTASYDVETLALEGPFQPRFDEFRLGVPAAGLATVDGSWNLIGGVDRTEIQLRVVGLGGDEDTRVDAVWRGAIVARIVAPTDRVTEVSTAFPDTDGIDEEIVAELGSLPSDPAALEGERRSRFLTRARAVVAQPDALTGTVLAAWLERLGVGSVSELMAHPGGAVAGTAQVTFSPPSAAAPSPMPLPITAILLIRDGGFSVADLLADSHRLRDRLGAFGVERPRETALPMREPVVVIWVVPAAVFDDTDWPGGGGGDAGQQRAGRRAAAGAWLAREGIGLVTTAPP